MNKKNVDKLIPTAYQKLKDTGIANAENQIQKTFRGQIAAFGAALTTGSLLAAVAFFGAQGSSEVDRAKLMQAIWLLLHENEKATTATDDAKKLFDQVSAVVGERNKLRLLKEQIMEAAVAFKLAMNLYKLV